MVLAAFLLLLFIGPIPVYAVCLHLCYRTIYILF